MSQYKKKNKINLKIKKKLIENLFSFLCINSLIYETIYIYFNQGI
jgi:hypothetical protein